MNCPQCSSMLVRKQENRTFLCKTGPVDKDLPQDIEFVVIVDDFISDECKECNKSFVPVDSILKLEYHRKRLLNGFCALGRKDAHNDLHRDVHGKTLVFVSFVNAHNHLSNLPDAHNWIVVSVTDQKLHDLRKHFKIKEL